MDRVKILADSISPEGKRLTSFEIEFARPILAEMVTHKILGMTSDPLVEYLFPSRTSGQDISKSSASSRAIPFNKMVEKCRSDPFMPEFSINQAGMQEAGFLDGDKKSEAEKIWLEAMESCIASATRLHELGVHKQDINRLIEPFSWVIQVVTGTEWANFFALRCDSMAHPAFRKIARAMYVAQSRSTPRPLEPGDWHLPYIDEGDHAVAGRMVKDGFPVDPLTWYFKEHKDQLLVRWSAARCARTSYKLFDGKRTTPEEDERLYQRLAGSTPKHMEPFSHQATPYSPDHPRLPYRSNLDGFLQHRKLIPLENVKEFTPSQEEIDSWRIPEEIFSV